MSLLNCQTGEMMDKLSGVMKKADIVLFAALILLGAALSVPALMWRDSGDTVRVTVNGKLFGTYKVSEDREVAVKKNGNTNIVVIKDGRVRMESASCKNQICVHTGKISRAGQSIVCLPNRVSVTIEGEGGGQYDAVSGK